MNFVVGIIIFVSEVCCVVNGTYMAQNNLPLVQLYLPKGPSKASVCTGAIISRTWFKGKIMVTFSTQV